MPEYSEKFLRAVEKTLEFEGGRSFDPVDPGGETNFGISKRSYPDLDIKALTRDQAIEIYYRDWWIEHGYERIDDPDVAAKVFDVAANMGPSRAHMLAQQAVNHWMADQGTEYLCVDGVIGPKSIAAINRAGPGLIDYLRLEQKEFYLRLIEQKPAMAKYRKGWLRRAAA